jgi:DNA-binding NtrC family response regulator
MKRKILICDDEKNVRDSLKLILANKYDIIMAENGKEAIMLIEQNPDLSCILVDIKMPESSGMELLKDIKNRQKHIPVIVVTGYQSVETAAESIQTGAIYYITKPFKSETIIETVERALSSAENTIPQ